MAAQQKDYYRVLGVPRSATAEEIKRAFRRDAKKHHPDHNSSKRSEERFKDLSEAYEVLGDPEKRRRYDAVTAGGGSWEEVFAQAQSAARAAAGESAGGAAGSFSNLFNAFRTAAGSAKPKNAPGAASSLESEMTITLEEACRGGARRVTLALREDRPLGVAKQTRKECDIKIPAGIRDGQRIRLRNGGAEADEDILIRIRIAAHPVFSFEGDDLVAEVKISPWEAALGESIQVPTLEGSVSLRVPPGVHSGQKLRLRDQGFPKKGGARGDLLYRLMIEVPSPITPQERALFEKLRDASRFNPRLGSS